MAQKQPEKSKGSELQIAGEIIKIPLDKIIADKKWNLRFGDPALASGGPDEDHEFLELVESFKAKGQQTPCLVTPTKDGKFKLRVGFRRFDAAVAVANQMKITSPYLLCQVATDMSEGTASLQNLAENVERTDVNPSDISWSLDRTKALLKKEGTFESDSALARMVGLKQNYVSKLLLIKARLLPNLFEHWRSSKVPLGVNDIYEISAKEAAEQEKAYKAATEPRESKAGSSGNGKVQKETWVRAKKQAVEAARLLAILVRQNFIKGLTPPGNLEVAYFLTKFDPASDKAKGITANQWKAIAKAAGEEYEKALKADYVVPTVSDDDDEEEAAE